MKKEVVIEVNPHGLLGDNRAWLRGINHPDLMQYTNVIWTEDQNNPRWEDGVAIGKFRHFKLGRTTNNFIMTYNGTPQDFAENLALNRTIADLPSGIPQGEPKKHLDFWRAHQDLYTQANGAERVAVLRSYPSMAYNNLTTHNAVNMAEQTLLQRQIPFDIIFDQQIDQLDRYWVLLLANQESLSDGVLNKILSFVENGGGLVITGDTGRYDRWRRLRRVRGLDPIFSWVERDETAVTGILSYGKGKAVYLPALTLPAGKDLDPRIWKMPANANELETAVLAVSSVPLPLRVDAPEWIGVSHDRQAERDIVHLFNYTDEPVAGVLLHYRGAVAECWSVSPQKTGKQVLPLEKRGDETLVRIPAMETYEIVVLER